MPLSAPSNSAQVVAQEHTLALICVRQAAPDRRRPILCCPTVPQPCLWLQHAQRRPFKERHHSHRLLHTTQRIHRPLQIQPGFSGVLFQEDLRAQCIFAAPFTHPSLAAAVICNVVKAARQEIACRSNAGSSQAALQNAPQLTCQKEEDQTQKDMPSGLQDPDRDISNFRGSLTCPGHNNRRCSNVADRAHTSIDCSPWHGLSSHNHVRTDIARELHYYRGAVLLPTMARAVGPSGTTWPQRRVSIAAISRTIQGLRATRSVTWFPTSSLSFAKAFAARCAAHPPVQAPRPLASPS